MVKLASARESRTYGPGRRARNRWEYINAGLYFFSTVLLVGGFAAQLSPHPVDNKSGLAVVLMGLVVVLVVNVHDLAAHLAGVEYCFALVEFDLQLALVEFAVPLVHVVGAILTSIGIFFFAIQMEKGYSERLEKHALNTLVVGPIFWVIGSIHNICQIYERASGEIQILQKCVQVPLLMGSLLFLVAGSVNTYDVSGFKILGKTWVWLCLSGSALFFLGGFLNMMRVFKMQQIDGVRLEKLRECAYERLGKDREDQLPLILENNTKKPEEAKTASGAPKSIPTPYKDALLNNV